MATLDGKMLGKYQVIERLGRGGMAEVYKAYHPQLDRYTAIKVLHHFLAEGKDFLTRFQREAKAIATLRHPNIVQVYDFESNDDLYYMVMEFVDGGTLKERITQANGPLPYAEIAHIFRETASALQYAHKQGVLHRDIKPANVLLGKDGRVVLTDFGIARILSDTQFTATGTLVGTPAYMSPEQGMGLKVNAASDIYSLGVVLYEMVTGKVPFNSETPLAVIHKHIHEPLPRPRSLRPDIPRELEKVIQKALEKDPTDRYSSAEELKRALDNALSGVRVPEQELHHAPTVDEALSSQTTPELYDKATIAMPPEDESAPEESIVSQPTVAMDAEPTKSPPIQKSETRHTRKTLPVKLIFGIIGAVLLALLLIWGIPKLGESVADCNSVESCHSLAEERLGRNDVNGAIAAIETAIGYVPENEHPPFAQFWCLKGEAYMTIEEFDAALWSFEDCQAWTEGDPDLEELRVFAQEKIDMIRNR